MYTPFTKIICTLAALLVQLFTHVNQTALVLSPQRPGPATILFDFTKPTPNLEWSHADDPVMGGKSSSRMRQAGSALYFEGTLSLENHGGFASSFVNNPHKDLSGYQRIRIRLKGDGRPYGLSILCQGTTYRSYFSTTGKEELVTVLFSSLQPTYYGEVVKDGKPLDAASMEKIGFVINDKKQGDFQLQVLRIEVE